MKRKIFTQLLLAVAVSLSIGCTRELPRPDIPANYGAVPSVRQKSWHNMEMYAFIHFTTTTYRDVEWGYGDASPDEFCPEKFDPAQWVSILKSAGMKGVIITAKHHDGFCLWPSKLTDYSVAASRWKDGRGDVIAALAREAKKQGLSFGVYLSPWDRHDLRYGTPEYVDYFRGQLRELLTQYGDIFEVWQDGANGGDGYYGGLRERRVIGKGYYGWSETDSLIRELQPMACIFSDAGPDTRWCGNEAGSVGDPNWCTLNKGDFEPGQAKTERLQHGDEGGSDWVPAEVDVSIRPGWFYHEREDASVKTVEQLMDIYYTSVGRGANLILNVPPTKDGLIHPIDSARLVEFGEALKREFSRPLKMGDVESITTTSQRRGFPVKNVMTNLAVMDSRWTDEEMKEALETYWGAKDRDREATITLTLRHPVDLYRLRLCEPIHKGQRISQFRVEAVMAPNEGETAKGGSEKVANEAKAKKGGSEKVANEAKAAKALKKSLASKLRLRKDWTIGKQNWETIAEGTTIGARRILRLPDVKVSALRVTVTSKEACPLLSEIQFFLPPADGKE